MDLFIILMQEEEVGVLRQNSKRVIIWGEDMLVLCDSKGSCCNLH